MLRPRAVPDRGGMQEDEPVKHEELKDRVQVWFYIEFTSFRVNRKGWGRGGMPCGKKKHKHAGSYLTEGSKWSETGQIGEEKVNLRMLITSKPLYVGTFRHSIDGQNRLTVPSKWRFSGDEKDVYLALPYPTGYIAVLPPPEIDKLYERAAQKMLSDAGAQETLSRLFAMGHTFGCDKQGRINIPATLLTHAGIDREALLVGGMTKFSIWNPARWQQLEARTEGETLLDLMRQAGL